jgi:DNA-binding NarL/FixJ family response regulator
MVNKVKVLLVDDQAQLRDWVQSFLDEEADIEVVAVASDSWSAVNCAVQTAPSVVVIEVGLPGVSGVQTARLIKEQCPEAKILALSNYNEERIVNSMLKAGASGFVPKTRAFEDLAPAIRRVASGEIYLNDNTAGIAGGSSHEHTQRKS